MMTESEKQNAELSEKQNAELSEKKMMTESEKQNAEFQKEHQQFLEQLWEYHNEHYNDGLEIYICGSGRGSV